uniref:Uncharacterized protein LOC113793039 n=1 Tax=Dermatophagoides pteronyssinus TaxID=6956 RepID=A0A6P6Y0K7_DERPT|nr:uncharacterized protein LOC113793039 [Dermatophagoides pteronyssinus]
MDITALKLFEHVPTLNDNNWPIWKWKVELALRHMEMWPLVSDEDSSQSTGQPNDDIKICSLIGLWVEDSLVPLIRDCKTSYQMWTKLSEHFEIGSLPVTSTESSSIPNENSKSKSAKKKELKCDFCQNDGHSENKCWRKKRITNSLKKYHPII